MYLYGASGHAMVIIDILKASGEKIEGIFDDDPEVVKLLEYTVSKMQEMVSPLIISIGSNKIRKMIAKRLDVVFGQAIHPSAIISENCEIKEGSVVMQGAILQSGVKVGKHCIVNTGASVDHECRIGDFVHVSPHCTLCGNVSVGEGTWVGAGTIVIPGVKIGKWSVIGAGSVVVGDIPEGVVAYGNPCKVIRKIEF